jgi:hypothetical protein
MFCIGFCEHRGSVVVKALFHKPEGRGFQICFQYNAILPALLGPGVFSEISSRSIKIMFLWSRARPVHRADNLTAICEPTV